MLIVKQQLALEIISDAVDVNREQDDENVTLYNHPGGGNAFPLNLGPWRLQ